MLCSPLFISEFQLLEIIIKVRVEDSESIVVFIVNVVATEISFVTVGLLNGFLAVTVS